MTLKRLTLVVLVVVLVVCGAAGCCVGLPIVLTGRGMSVNG